MYRLLKSHGEKNTESIFQLAAVGASIAIFVSLSRGLGQKEDLLNAQRVDGTLKVCLT